MASLSQRQIFRQKKHQTSQISLKTSDRMLRYQKWQTWPAAKILVKHVIGEEAAAKLECVSA